MVVELFVEEKESIDMASGALPVFGFIVPHRQPANLDSSRIAVERLQARIPAPGSDIGPSDALSP